MKQVSVGYNPQWGCDAMADKPLVDLMASHNFDMWHTGGGCMAWGRWTDDKGYVWITDEGGTDLGTWARRGEGVWIVGRYSEDGEQWVCCNDDMTLAQALALADVMPKPEVGTPDLCDRFGKFKAE